MVSATVDPTSGAASNVSVRRRRRTGSGRLRRPRRSCTSDQPTPTNTGSVGNTFTLFKKLRLYALVDWKRGNVLLNNIDRGARCDGLLGIGVCDVNYHPQKYSPLYVAEASFTGLVNQTQDQFFQDASFVKLREVSATYSLPDHLLPGIEHASFTLAARELALWTKYKGPDPGGQPVRQPGSDAAIRA